ncbi:hypothetical protein QBC41DRAFT_238720, partial [Cercophora samala]
ILFIRKANRLLKFYIDYCKLNVKTIKDYYLLLLIDKIISRILKVKIFFKVNI